MLVGFPLYLGYGCNDQPLNKKDKIEVEVETHVKVNLDADFSLLIPKSLSFAESSKNYWLYNDLFRDQHISVEKWGVASTDSAEESLSAWASDFIHKKFDLKGNVKFQNISSKVGEAAMYVEIIDSNKKNPKAYHMAFYSVNSSYIVISGWTAEERGEQFQSIVKYSVQSLSN